MGVYLAMGDWKSIVEVATVFGAAVAFIVGVWQYRQSPPADQVRRSTASKPACHSRFQHH